MKKQPNPLSILRRVGPDPHANGEKTIALSGCPDFFELKSGDFLLIGADVSDAARAELPSGASCGPDERIIRVPRRTIVLAKRDIPDRL